MTMEQYRLLLPNERDALLNIYKADAGRKVLHMFFNIWRCMFLLCAVVTLWNTISAIIAKNYSDLFGIVVIIPAFFGFWVFPSFILKRIDTNYTALKNNQVYIKNTALVSTRHNRERISQSSGHYKDVYYASITSDNNNSTYEILAHKSVFDLPAGTVISVLRFDNSNSVNQEYALPVDFLYNKSYSSLPM